MAGVGDGAGRRVPGRPAPGPASATRHESASTDRAPVRASFPGVIDGSSVIVVVGDDGQVVVDGAAIDGRALIEGASGGAIEAASDAGHSDARDDGAPGVSHVRITTPEGAHLALVIPMPDRRRSTIGVERVEVIVDGWRFEVDVEAEARARLRERATSAKGAAAGGGPLELRAIIPGRIVSVDVAAGDLVEPGGRLLVLEAMKMQNELRSPRGGTVARVAVGAGQTVERGDVLLVLE